MISKASRETTKFTLMIMRLFIRQVSNTWLRNGRRLPPSRIPLPARGGEENHYEWEFHEQHRDLVWVTYIRSRKLSNFRPTTFLARPTPRADAQRNRFFSGSWVPARFQDAGLGTAGGSLVDYGFDVKNGGSLQGEIQAAN